MEGISRQTEFVFLLLRSPSVALAGRVCVLQHQHQDAAVGMEAAAGCGTGFGERVGRRDVGALHYQTGARKSVVGVLALTVNRWIDLVCDAVIALIALETDIVRGCHAPQRAAV